MDQNESGTRINRYISERDFCSRREADKLIAEGHVTINGKVAEMGSKVGPKDFVKVDGKPLKAPAIHVYLALNKPVGIVSTTDSAEPDNIVDFVKYSKRIFPIGRLDKDSEGLILLTNDGDIVNKVLRAGNAHEKEYVVTVTTPINEGFMMGMAAGVPILDTVTKPCTVKQTGKRTFKIILTEGMNRQIRRMCEHFGYEVESLKRIRIMDIYLRDLPLGKWRHLTKEEIKSLKNAVKASVKTEEASTAVGPKPKRKPRPSARPTAPSHKAFKPRAKKSPSSSRAVAKR